MNQNSPSNNISPQANGSNHSLQGDGADPRPPRMEIRSFDEAVSLKSQSVHGGKRVAAPKWTQDEIEYVREGVAAGIPLHELAKQLGRSRSAVWAKAAKEEILHALPEDHDYFKNQDAAFQRAMLAAAGEGLERVKVGVKGPPSGDFHPKKFSKPETPGLQTNWNF